MSSPGRILLAVLPLAALAIAFWLLVLAPKRQEAADLKTDAANLQAQVDEQVALAEEAEAARKDFPSDYRQLVVLGKAAPEEDDTSSFLVQLDQISANADVEFVSLTAEEGGEAAAPAPPPTATPQTPADTAEQAEQKVESVDEGGAPVPGAPAAATEATAALLPIGATVGPAGLPVMHYSLKFQGEFFKLADFVAGIDKMVRTSADGELGIRGRLVTIDSFELAPSESADPLAGETVPQKNPSLSANFTITTYLTPADVGLTGGASPAGPALTSADAGSIPPPPAEPSTTASTVAP